MVILALFVFQQTFTDAWAIGDSANVLRGEMLDSAIRIWNDFSATCDLTCDFDRWVWARVIYPTWGALMTKWGEEAWDTTGHWDDKLILVRDTLWAYGVGADTSNVRSIGRAYSADNGFTWTDDVANNPVKTVSGDSYEIDIWEVAPEWDSVNSLINFYMQAVDSGGNMNTLWYTSADGITWNARNNGRPVLWAGQTGHWDNRYCGARTKYVLRDTHWICYEGTYDDSLLAMGMAWGLNESTFTKVDTVYPTINGFDNADSVWTNKAIIPIVRPIGGMHVCWYGAKNRKPYHENGWGMASSKDGRTFEKYAGNPITTMEEVIGIENPLNAAMIDMFFDGQQLCGTVRWGGLGSWFIECECDDIAVEEANEGGVASYRLQLKIYPNPSFGNVLIKYGLPEKTDINLNLYDISGRLVKMLYSGIQEKGYHDVWQKELSAGIYFIRLDTDNYKTTRKLTILK